VTETSRNIAGCVKLLFVKNGKKAHPAFVTSVQGIHAPEYGSSISGTVPNIK
jgi:hypothetical protein